MGTVAAMSHPTPVSPDPAPDEGARARARRDELTDLERAVLDLEAATWRYGGAKDHAVRERLGLSPTAYYQVLNGLLDREAALAYRPLLVARLLRNPVAGLASGAVAVVALTGIALLVGPPA